VGVIHNGSLCGLFDKADAAIDVLRHMAQHRLPVLTNAALQNARTVGANQPGNDKTG
jgi:hypothetical protein